MPQALIVDDEQYLVLIATELFEEAGFNTIPAYSADDARLILDQRGDQIDLLFTDVRLPGATNGLDLAQFAAAQWPTMGILLASGVTPPADDIPASAMFISKPYTVEEVLARLDHLVSRKGAAGDRSSPADS